MNKALKSNRPKKLERAKKKKKKIACLNAHDVFSNLFEKNSKRARTNCKSNQLGSVFLKKFKI